jgi:Protein-L-isoaspartate(D-aspartate) O-methyltransferase (PCMT)
MKEMDGKDGQKKRWYFSMQHLLALIFKLNLFRNHSIFLLRPYDLIHVGAAAESIPKALLDQLAPGGRLIIPVGVYAQSLKQVDKGFDGTCRTKDLVRELTDAPYFQILS